MRDTKTKYYGVPIGLSLIHIYNLGKAIGLKLLSEQQSSGYLQITGTPGTIVPVGWLAGTVAGLQFVVMAQGEIGAEGTVLLPAQATTAGPEGNVAAGTVTVVINPGIPEGITAVTNPAAFDGGRARDVYKRQMPVIMELGQALLPVLTDVLGTVFQAAIPLIDVFGDVYKRQGPTHH